MSQQHVMQVSELTKKVRFLLESEMRTVWLCGEISNFMAAGSGHWYLTLKDQFSQVKCAMFKGNNRSVRIKPANGQQVLVKARVSLYEPRGDFQLIIEQMDDAGVGLLQQQFERLKAKLLAEGVFDQRYKQPLPNVVNTVGVVTSATGAAIHDILTVFKRRSPQTRIVIYPTLVQGELAAVDIVKQIETANLRQECDVLIVGRGGGSLEDLWCFNEEVVVRAIFNSELPILSAVGHEVDTTLADYVADYRAPTPSAAAEILSQDMLEIIKRIDKLAWQCKQALLREVKNKALNWQTLTQRLNRLEPTRQIQVNQQRADELTSRLLRQQQLTMSNSQLRLRHLAQRLHQSSPARAVEQGKIELSRLTERLLHQIHRYQERKTQRFVNAVEQLHMVSPLATLARGYSVTRNSAGKIINNSQCVKVGEEISIQLHKGNIVAKVQQTQ
ncbi:exodeoxyribonuclease VII large subunit [Thalassotalea fusca]